MPRPWAELTVTVGAEHLEAVSNFLIEAGAPGVEVRENPPSIEVVAYFSGRPPVAALRLLLADLGGKTDGIATRRVGDEAWSETWKRHCYPQTIGRRLYVCPSWEAQRAPADRLHILVDPGMAFGTGDHPTTRSCLLLVERVADSAPLRRVLDCGTGSGILAIAAAKLGAQEVWAIDTDPIARATATANGDLNGVGDRLRVVDSIDVVSAPFDVILANLFADLLIELAPRFRAVLAPAGWVACAGFLDADADRVQRCFKKEGFRATHRVTEEGWVTLQLRGS